MDEIWKDKKDYEEHYQVSNLGRVKSIKFGKERILKQRQCMNGYYCVNLSKNGIVKSYYVHRLVAEAFIPNPNNLPLINHKDECKTNNVVTNLEWCDRSYNNNYGTARQRMAEKQSKTVLQYTLDGQFVREWLSAKQAEIEGGFNQENICMCCRGKRKYHHNFIWRYK